MAGGGAGESWKLSMVDMLNRMETGRTRASEDKIGRNLVNWFHGSTALALFGNRKSMLTQLLSITNYAKMGENNIFQMGKTIAQDPQYWIENMKFIAKHGGYLKARGSDWNLSLKELTEIETKFKDYKDKAVGMSFVLSKLGDRAAILMGGSTFLINTTKRIREAYPDMSWEKAREIAFYDFVKHTEGTQQSTWANFLSKQQTKASGKLLLNFLNTQMRYNNISLAEMKKLQKGVGGLESIGKILNYSGLQVAAFAFATEGVGFLLADTEMDDNERSRRLKEQEMNAYLKSMNNIIEGTGISGKAATTVIGMIQEAYPMLTGEKKRAADIALKSLQMSPAIQIKFKKLQAMGYEMAAGNYLRAGTKMVSATTNFGGFESIADLVDQYNFIFNERYTTMQHVAVALGWSPYSQDKDYYKHLKEGRLHQESPASLFDAETTSESRFTTSSEEESVFDVKEQESRFK